MSQLCRHASRQIQGDLYRKKLNQADLQLCPYWTRKTDMYETAPILCDRNASLDERHDARRVQYEGGTAAGSQVSHFLHQVKILARLEHMGGTKFPRSLES